MMNEDFFLFTPLRSLSWESLVRSCPFLRCSSYREPSIKVTHEPTSDADGTSCKPSASYPCYIQYLLSLYYRGYGQVRDLFLEDARMGDPSLVIQAPNINLSQADIATNLGKALKLLIDQGIRKRFMAVQFSHGTYIIGGYEYIVTESRRQTCKHDYMYDHQLDRLLPLQPLPDGRVSFAVCTDGRQIICAGGHTYLNVALKSVYMFDTDESIWRRLPDLPAPTSGAGIAFDQQKIHLLGGFDIILNRSVVHGEYVVYDLTNEGQGWLRRAEIDPGRARPLLLIIVDPQNPSETAIFSAGGYEIDPSHQPHAIARLEQYNERFGRWEFISPIENLQLDHGLAYANNRLDVIGNNKRLKQYDFRTQQWSKVSEKVQPSQETGPAKKP